MKINMPRICSKSVKGMKLFQMRMKRKLETNKINVSRICTKNVTGMKLFQMRMKLKFVSLEGGFFLRSAGPYLNSHKK